MTCPYCGATSSSAPPAAAAEAMAAHQAKCPLRPPEVRNG